jgi:hypothetical protein
LYVEISRADAVSVPRVVFGCPIYGMGAVRICGGVEAEIPDRTVTVGVTGKKRSDIRPINVVYGIAQVHAVGNWVGA